MWYSWHVRSDFIIEVLQMHPQTTRWVRLCKMLLVGNAKALVMAVLWESPWCMSQVCLDYCHRPICWNWGPCLSSCWLGRKISAQSILILWWVDWCELKRTPKHLPAAGHWGMESVFLAPSSSLTVNLVIYMKGQGAIVKFYSLAFSWFLSIKLNTDNRLISAVKCLKFLTTSSIRWKKHNNV